MGFGDLQSREGLGLLNSFLADKSYIEGWVIDCTIVTSRID
jgi:hypothetical protein